MKKRLIPTLGLSIIELLIVLAVISLLVSLVTSSNQKKLNRVALMQAQLDLLALAGKMEEYKLTNATYVGAAGSLDSRTASGVPWIFSSYSPSTNTEEHKRYTLHIESSDKTSYQLVAVPEDQKFQKLSYNSKGEKYWDKDANGVFSSDENCWKC